MGRYLIRRVISSIIALFLFLTFMFFVTEMLIPHDFTVQFALTMDRETREQLAEELGIDRPLGERYVNWLRRLVQGSLGTSFYGYPVVMYLKGLIPYTLLVFFTGTLMFWGDDGSLRSSILIRSVVTAGDRFWLGAGGGVVWDSEPEAEWRESNHKARALTRGLGFEPERIA